MLYSGLPIWYDLQLVLFQWQADKLTYITVVMYAGVEQGALNGLLGGLVLRGLDLHVFWIINTLCIDLYSEVYSLQASGRYNK